MDQIDSSSRLRSINVSNKQPDQELVKHYEEVGIETAYNITTELIKRKSQFGFINECRQCKQTID